MSSHVLSVLPGAQTEVPSTNVPLWRLYALRATYLLIIVGLGSEIWPLMLRHRPWEIMHGVANSMLSAVAVMAVIGLRYPLKMLPLFFFETVWKTTWLVAIALPAWKAGAVDANMAETVRACLMGVIFPIVIPWRYVAANFVAAHGDRWW